MLVALLAAVLVLVLGHASMAHAAPGDLDGAFDGDGKLTTSFGSGKSGANDVAIQSDGKIVAVGYSTSSAEKNFALARYKPNGTLDDGFGGTGKVKRNFGPGDDSAQAVALQGNKILVAGYAHNGSNYDFALLRFDSDGSLDTTFGSTGEAITDFASTKDQAFDLAIQQDGKIVVVGRSGSDFAVARYEPDGSLDATFDGNAGNGNGKVTTDLAGRDDVARAVAIAPDGKIVAAGSSVDSADNSVFSLARYKPQDGTLDNTFDADGKKVDEVTAFSWVNDLAIQQDKKIVMAGSYEDPSVNVILPVLRRYNEDGAQDPAFDFEYETGKKPGTLEGRGSVAYGVGVQPDGKVVAAGVDYNLSATDSRTYFALNRYGSAGKLDAGFGNSGQVRTRFGSGMHGTFADDGARAFAFQPDGKIVAAGGSEGDFALARYHGGEDATPPSADSPVHRLVQNSTLGATKVPVDLGWSATDANGQVAGYQLQQSKGGGAYTNVPLTDPEATSLTRRLASGNAYRFRVRAQDDNGNLSSWRYGPTFRLRALQENAKDVKHTGDWIRRSIESAYGGALKYSTARDDTAKLTFRGRNVSWVAPKGPSQGRAEVYLDGTRVATVDLYSPTGQPRRMVFDSNDLDPSISHVLKVRVLGTKNAASRGTRVDVDAFVVLR